MSNKSMSTFLSECIVEVCQCLSDYVNVSDCIDVCLSSHQIAVDIFCMHFSPSMSLFRLFKRIAMTATGCLEYRSDYD